MTIIDTETITEDEAFRVYYALSQRFGWAGSFFTRGDAEGEWQSQQALAESPIPFTDELWNDVTNTYWWSKGLPDRMTEDGWNLVAEAVREVMENNSVTPL